MNETVSRRTQAAPARHAAGRHRPDARAAVGRCCKRCGAAILGPLVLVGHPYGVDENGLMTLAAMAALKMDVSIDAETW